MGRQRAAREVDAFSQLAGYVVVRMTGLWPDKMAKLLPDARASQLFVSELARQLAAWRVPHDLVEAGLARMVRECRWPPVDVPELLRFFSPVRDYEAAFHEAARLSLVSERELVPLRAWSHPAVYWAGDRFGWFEVRNTAFALAAPRWALVLDEVVAWGDWPEPAPLLPTPGKLQTEGARRAAMAEAMRLLQGAQARFDDRREADRADGDPATLRRGW